MRYCAASGCKSSQKKGGFDSKKSFFKFPLKHPEVLRTWLVNIKRENFVPSIYSKLCSDHFTESCFHYENFTNRRLLKVGAIPTLCLPAPTCTTQQQPSTSYFVSNTANDKEKVLDVTHTVESKRRNTVNKFEKYFKSIDTSCQSERDFLLHLREKNENDEDDEGNETDDSDASSDGSLDNVLLEDYMNENLPKHSKNGPIEEKIGAMRSKLMATVMKRALKRSLLESEIKAAHARKAYFDSKKSFLTPTNAVKSSSGMPISFNDLKVFEDLKVQVMSEELAGKTEKRVLQKQLFEAEIQAATSKRGYYSAKKATLLVPNDT